ncbi:MAG TPA: hypothetical protein VMS11_01255 [Solirubrobacterales bacterium]|nr:hypothetical protein [Solirubrobacterales bacterium]
MRRLVPFALALAVGLVAAPAAGARDADWKLTLTVDYSSTGTATDSHCFPDPAQIAPSPLSASATREVTIRTIRPLFVEMYEAPNGVPATITSSFDPAARMKLAETRDSGLDTSGSPLGCHGGGTAPTTDCGTKSRTTGVYINPLGNIHHWRGFTLELESEAPPFSRCGLAGAQQELPDPLQIDVKATPGQLTGTAPKLVFRDSVTPRASDRHETTISSATGKLTYTVKLVRDR